MIIFTLKKKQIYYGRFPSGHLADLSVIFGISNLRINDSIKPLLENGMDALLVNGYRYRVIVFNQLRFIYILNGS